MRAERLFCQINSGRWTRSKDVSLSPPQRKRKVFPTHNHFFDKTLLPFLLCLWLLVATGCQTGMLSVALIQTPTPTPIAAPARLQIPRLGLDVRIERVGQTEGGQMAVPQNPDQVGWYGIGATPGERGNAVISGHLDDRAGPAVFWQLDQLTVGDEVMVVDVTGATHTFAVIETARYAQDAAPLDKIFGFDLERDLNLITCDGVWNRKTQRYGERLVVYTRLVTPP